MDHYIEKKTKEITSILKLKREINYLRESIKIQEKRRNRLNKQVKDFDYFIFYFFILIYFLMQLIFIDLFLFEDFVLKKIDIDFNIIKNNSFTINELFFQFNIIRIELLMFLFLLIRFFNVTNLVEELGLSIIGVYSILIPTVVFTVLGIYCVQNILRSVHSLNNTLNKDNKIIIVDEINLINEDLKMKRKEIVLKIIEIRRQEKQNNLLELNRMNNFNHIFLINEETKDYYKRERYSKNFNEKVKFHTFLDLENNAGLMEQEIKLSQKKKINRKDLINKFRFKDIKRPCRCIFNHYNNKSATIEEVKKNCPENICVLKRNVGVFEFKTTIKINEDIFFILKFK